MTYPASNKQLWMIASLIEQNAEKSKTQEKLFKNLKEKWCIGSYNYTKSIYFALKAYIKTSQDASYIINCLLNNYTHSMKLLINKFKELKILAETSQKDEEQEKK